MKLIFEKGAPGHHLDLFPEPNDSIEIDSKFLRQSDLHLPEVSETELSRHYTELADHAFGVNDGFYPLGSCTMKYNPKVNEMAASLEGFTNIHPLQDDMDTQGCIQVMVELQDMLCRITGMDACTLQPAAGAHGEFTGLLMIKKYLELKGETNRTKIIVPDSAHGTNPASANMAGFTIVNIASDEHGFVNLDALKAAVGDDTAGLMLTNPNTVGLFDEQILDITSIVHDAGGLCYYDGANMNAIMGIARPGDMGFDVMHMNLHKTFSTPHGGGGPGSGPVACKAFLAEYLPGLIATKESIDPEDESILYYSFTQGMHSIGDMKSFYGNFLVMVKAYVYLLSIGSDGIKEASTNAVLNANYMMRKLAPYYQVAYDHTCMHEFVVTLQEEKKNENVTALDIAKALLDKGIHAPTMYFPLIVHEALMIEPTETESKATLDEAIQIFIDVLKQAQTQPETMHQYPLNAAIKRPDEVKAARDPILRYVWE